MTNRGEAVTTALNTVGIDLSLKISDSAACAGMGEKWDDLEKRFLLAETQADALAVQWEVQQICAGCPLADYQACEEWAEGDRYTGWAAGKMYQRGRPVDVKSRRAGAVLRRELKEAS